MFKTIISIGLSLLLAQVLIGQDLAQEMSRMTHKMETSDQLSFDYTVTVYQQENGQESILHQSGGYVRKSGDKICSKNNTVVSVKNKEHYLLIDEELKFIQVVDLQDVDHDLMDELLGARQVNNIDYSKHAQYMGTSNGLHQYKVMTQGPIVEAELWINPKTEFLDHLVYYYNEKTSDLVNKVIVRYTGVDFSSIPDNNLFLTEHYVRKTSGKYTPENAYSTYQIISNEDEE